MLFGAEIINTTNNNYRYNTYFSNTKDDNEVFNITDPMDFTVNAAGQPSTNDYSADLKSKTKSDIEVTSIYFQDQIDVSDNLKLMIGGRHDTFDITVTDVTAQNITAVGATFTGTVSYENIQNLDSVGLVTARAGLKVGPLTGIAATIDIGGNFIGGIVTASSFSGDGSGLSGVVSGVDIKSGGSFLGAGVTAVTYTHLTLPTKRIV